MSEGEWLALMLEEIERKRAEQAEALSETERRAEPAGAADESTEQHRASA